MSVLWQSPSHSVFIQEPFFMKSSNTLWLWLSNILDPNLWFIDQLDGNVRPFSHNMLTSITVLDPPTSTGLGWGCAGGDKRARATQEKKEMMVMLHCLEDQRWFGFVLNSQQSAGLKLIYCNLSNNNNFEWLIIDCENLFSWTPSSDSLFANISSRNAQLISNEKRYY